MRRRRCILGWVYAAYAVTGLAGLALGGIVWADGGDDTPLFDRDQRLLASMLAGAALVVHFLMLCVTLTNRRNAGPRRRGPLRPPLTRPRACPGCGYDLRAGHRRCPECGRGLLAGPRPG